MTCNVQMWQGKTSNYYVQDACMLICIPAQFEYPYCKDSMNMHLNVVIIAIMNINLHAYWDCTTETTCRYLPASTWCLPAICQHWLHLSASIPFTFPPGSLLQSFNRAPHSDGIWDYLPLLSPSASFLCRHSGTDWQGTLFLIRQMAWGETLIWTSSASKRTAPPGWAQGPETANYTTLMPLPPWLIHSIKACVSVYVWKRERGAVEILFPIIHPNIYYLV